MFVYWYAYCLLYNDCIFDDVIHLMLLSIDALSWKTYLKDKGGEGNMELIFCVVESITSAGTMRPCMPIVIAQLV